MCHHRELEYERLYENVDEREELPDWANDPDGEDADAEESTSETPFAPSAADD